MKLSFKNMSSRRGFNLVEAAIVLGVIGLVIGGIWVAAASVQSRTVRNDIIQTMSLAIAQLQSDFRNIPPATSGSTGLNGYLTAKGIWNYPYLSNSQPWLGNTAPDGTVMQVTYHAAGSGYAGQAESFTISFGSIQPEDCYAYINSLQGYSGLINGHGDYATAEQIKAAATPTTTPAFFCINHLTNQIALIFPR